MHILLFSDESLQEALAVLRAGGVIAHATETCYGLACDLTDKAAVEKLFAIKQRPVTQPVSGLFASVEQAKEYAIWNGKAETLAGQYLPGPLTIILPLRTDAPRRLFPVADFSSLTSHPSPSIGIRISSHPHAQALIAAFGGILSTTSANIHGLPNPYSAAEIAREFEGSGHQPDLVLDSGELPQNPPSTVVDCSGETVQQKRPGDLRI